MDDKNQVVEFVLNHKQMDFFDKIDEQMTFEGVKEIAVIGGVGSGKTFTEAILLKRFFDELPRATVQFACNAVAQVKRAITPELKATLKEYLFCEEYDQETGEGELVFWKKPPSVFEKPYREPDNYENCISHINGTVIEFCGYSLYPDAHRSRNDDALVIDEASRFKKEWLKIATGRVRANVGKFESNLHHICVYFSNPNYNPEGDWIWSYEELELDEPTKYGFILTCTMDNLSHLPKGYVESKKKTLLDFEYNVEVLGQKVTKMKNSYYAALRWNLHADIDEESFYCTDIETVISADFNVKFTSCTMWQQQGDEHRCYANTFVKEAAVGNTMAESLGIQIDKELTLRSCKCKTIILTGDRNGSNTSAGSKMKLDGTYESQFDQLEAKLIDLGYTVILEPLNYNPFKNEVHELIQDILLENKREDFYLRFHPTHAKQTLISMTFTPIKDDFTKDKRSEQRKSIQQEHATHLSDTVDYYCYYTKNGGRASSTSDFELDFI